MELYVTERACLYAPKDGIEATATVAITTEDNKRTLLLEKMFAST